MKDRSLFIVTGMSGAGKSSVIRTLEDCGFYCVDNLPIALFPKFLELIEGAGDELGNHIALGLDLREGRLDRQFPEVYELLRKSHLNLRILFVNASDATLIKRFSETRRPHPLAPHGTVQDSITQERGRLARIRPLADWVLNTTDLNVHELRKIVRDKVKVLTDASGLIVNLFSFGFSHGLPPEASLVFDVRFLPNPHFVQELRPMTGEDDPVFRYVCDSAEGQEFLERLHAFLSYLIPQYQKEGKSYLTIAVGCTGGRHRSVAVARWLYDTLRKETGLAVNVRHRDTTR